MVLPKAIFEVQREAIEEALVYTHGKMDQAAAVLQIGRTTLYRKVREYDLADFAFAQMWQDLGTSQTILICESNNSGSHNARDLDALIVAKF